MDSAAATLSFAEQLVLMRRRSGQRQKTVAARCGLDPSYLASLENGRRNPPGPALLSKILDALDATSDDRRVLKNLAFCHGLKKYVTPHVPPEMTDFLLLSATLSSTELRAMRVILDQIRGPVTKKEEEMIM